MWVVDGNKLQFAEGDWGIQLPVTVSGITLTANDRLRFVFKKAKNDETPLLEKEYTPSDNAANLELTEAESALFQTGGYVYVLDLYQSGSFLCNLVPSSSLKVVDKA